MSKIISKLFKSDKRVNDLRPQILTYFVSGVMTDDERARLLGLPKGCRVREGAKIIAPENFKCGKYVWIGEYALLDASGGLTIGDYTQIGLHTLVWTHTSYLQALRAETCRSGRSIIRKPTSIGKCCFIGGPTVVYPGVTIEDYVVVLPLSVVTKDLASGYIYAGAPAKKVRKLMDDELNPGV